MGSSGTGTSRNGPGKNGQGEAEDSRFHQAVARFDEIHRQDPDRITVDGKRLPRELHYAHAMAAWVARLEEAPSEALRLAAHCQHLARWSIPRAEFPEGAAGYHRWRATLAKRHADLASEILEARGYDTGLITKVRDLVRKKNLGTDPETQTLEDAACLIFLETQLSDFAAKHDREKTLDILRKTWKKMSARGQKEARALSLPATARDLVREALEG